MKATDTTVPSASPHESHYDVVAAAIATAAATMLTLLTTLGTSNVDIGGSTLLKLLLEAQLLDLELSLIVSVVALLRRGDTQKRTFVLVAAGLLVLGTLLLWVSATIIIATV